MDDRRGDDRGQLILIAGVGIAVAFVALALILNSLVFTQYLATKPTVDGGGAIAYEHAVEDGVRGLVSEANYREYGPGVDDTVENGVEGNWSTSLTRQYGAYGTLVNTSVRDVESGTSIHQDTSRAFENKSGNGNWTLFDVADGVRAFQIGVNRASLATGPERAFRINVTASDGADMSVAVYRNGSGGIVVNETESGTAKTCVHSGAATTIDFDTGTVGGSACGELALFDREDTTGISFANGNRGAGQYVAVVNDPMNAVDDGDFHTVVEKSPYIVPAVYAVSLNATYAGPDVTYATTVEVSPSAFGAGPNGDDVRYGVFSPTRSLVFVNAATGNLSTIDPKTHVVTDYGVDAAAIGPKEYDFDGDDATDIPYVNSSNVLKLTDGVGAPHVLAHGAAKSSTTLGVGYWRGETSVFYVNTSDNDLWRATMNGTQEIIVNSASVSAVAAFGVADFNRDGDDDLVYSSSKSTSYAVWFIDNGDAISTQNAVAHGNGIGGGAPHYFGRYGVRIPMVDGSGNVNLFDYQASKEPLTSSGPAAKAPVAGIRWNDDSTREVIYVDSGTSELRYVTLDDMTKPIETENGTIVTAEKGPGVA